MRHLLAQVRTRPRTFIILCTVLGSLVFTTTVLVRFVVRHNYQDFPQYYMAGVIARHAAWEDLYPIPVEGSSRNIGNPDAGIMRPRYAELAAQHGVPDSLRFVQAPPNALLLYPLAMLPYKQAHLAWTIGCIALGVAVAWQAGLVYRRLAGRDTPAAGLVILLVLCSPNLYQSARMGQTSMLIGACLGMAVLGLAAPERSGFRAGSAIFFATMVKYAGAILFPVAIATRRWRTIGWAVGGGAAAILLSLLVMGLGPWLEWLTSVAPTLPLSHEWAANQSAYGLVARLSGLPLPGGLSNMLAAGRWATLALVLTVIFTRPRTAWESPAVVFAGCAALLAWMHIFSPIFWNHYYPYLFPLWGWLAWEGLRSLRVGLAAALAFALAWVPIAITGIGEALPEPVRTHMLWSAAIVLGIALWRLTRPRPVDGPELVPTAGGDRRVTSAMEGRLEMGTAPTPRL